MVRVALPTSRLFGRWRCFGSKQQITSTFTCATIVRPPVFHFPLPSPALAPCPPPPLPLGLPSHSHPLLFPTIILGFFCSSRSLASRARLLEVRTFSALSISRCCVRDAARCGEARRQGTRRTRGRKTVGGTAKGPDNSESLTYTVTLR